MMLMQGFCLPLTSTRLNSPRTSERAAAIHSNSNILFLHKDAEILFFSGSGDLHFMVWEASMYKLWLRDLSPRFFFWFLVQESFSCSKAFCSRKKNGFHLLLRRLLVRNSTPYSVHSHNLIIKWNKFIATNIFNRLLFQLTPPSNRIRGSFSTRKLQAINFILDGFYRLIRNDNKLF